MPRKSVVRLTDRPDMTLDVYRGRKTTKQQKATWNPLKGSLANSVDQDQTPHNVASDQGRHCLLTGFSSKIE